MNSYQEHALNGASAVDLVVALYDGIIRFLYVAIESVESGDQAARRIAVKRALDIIIHLQARLRMDVGGRPAQALSEFYSSVLRRSCRPRNPCQSPSSSMPSIVCAMSAMRGGRWPGIPRSIPPRFRWPACLTHDQRLRAMAATRSSVLGKLDAAAHPATVSSSSSCCFW